MKVEDVTIAGFDQQLAEALVDLRRCKGFILTTVNDDFNVTISTCLPDVGDGDDGEFPRLVMVQTMRTLAAAVLSP